MRQREEVSAIMNFLDDEVNELDVSEGLGLSLVELQGCHHDTEEASDHKEPAEAEDGQVSRSI